MANPQHIQWLKEGVAAWNARRDKADFFPDFSGANIPAALQGPLYDPSTIRTDTHLDGINLKNASFRGASLSGIGLRRANLQSAQNATLSVVSADLTAPISPIPISQAQCSFARPSWMR